MRQSLHRGNRDIYAGEDQRARKGYAARRTQTFTVSEHAQATGHYPIWNEVKFIDRDPYWYTRRGKGAIRICTSKLDFIRRLRRLSSRLLHQGFKSMLLRKSFTKFFKRHSAIIEKYGTTLREIRQAIQN